MLGIDLVETKDFKEAVDKYGDYFLSKIFTKDELKPLLPLKRNNVRKLAGYFAIKEAVVKALGLKNFKWQDIEIRNNGDEIKVLTLNSNRVFSKKELSVSICSTRDCIIATALSLT